MHCAFCGKATGSNARCVNGHFICDECHARKCIDAVRALCLQSEAEAPVELLTQLMRLQSVHMHGPEHHFIVAAALLTAYHNGGGMIDLVQCLDEAIRRGGRVPGGVCGLWGCCGAGVSTGIYMSLITGAMPLGEAACGIANRMTAKSLQAIGAIDGPRCCKRNSYTAVLEAVRFTIEHTGIAMELPVSIECEFFPNNAECIGKRCPYFPARKGASI